MLLALLLLSCVVLTVTALRPRVSLRKAAPSSAQRAEKQNPALDFLSGKTQIAAFKKSNPALFQSGTQVSKKGTAKKGGPYDLADEDIAACFQSFARVIGDESTALKMVDTYPDVLLLDAEKVRANLATYTGKWGEEKALGVVTRNPALFSIPVSGYGSAEVAGDDAVVLSYVIAYTRPVGGLLLGLLFAALVSKAFTTF